MGQDKKTTSLLIHENLFESKIDIFSEVVLMKAVTMVCRGILKIWHEYDKSVKTKIQKVLRSSFLPLAKPHHKNWQDEEASKGWSFPTLNSVKEVLSYFTSFSHMKVSLKL